MEEVVEEEAGLRAGRITKLAVLHEVPEFARSVGHLYVASELTRVPTRRDEGEATMTVDAYSVDELRDMVSPRYRLLVAACLHPQCSL